jgi:hypothetical protein
MSKPTLGEDINLEKMAISEVGDNINAFRCVHEDIFMSGYKYVVDPMCRQQQEQQLEREITDLDNCVITQDGTRTNDCTMR